MKELVKLSVIAFSVALGVMVAGRLNAEAVAVVVGVIAGALAGFPMSLLVLLVLRRTEPGHGEPKRRGQRSTSAWGEQQAYPPVVVVSPGPPPGQMGYAGPWQGYLPAGQALPAAREFRIVGEDDTA